MLIRLLFFLSLLFLAFFSKAQVSGGSVFLECRKNRMDVFTQFGYAAMFQNLEVRGSLGFGINRTLSQQRCFPRFTTGISYDLLKKYRSYLGPDLHFSVSSLRVNQKSGRNHFLFENMAGIRYCSPGKLRFVAGLSAGWIIELLKSQLDSQYMSVGTWGYEFSMGISYAW